MNSICKRMVRDIVRRRRRKGQMQVFSQAARSSRDRLILSESDYHRLLDLVSRELRSGRSQLLPPKGGSLIGRL